MTRQFASILLTIALSGCHSDGSNGPHGGVTGIYALRSVNGLALPTLGNGSAMTEFTMIADTITVHEDGYGVEVLVTSRPGAGVQRQVQPFQLTFTDQGYVGFDVAYPCNDQLTAVVVAGAAAASCIAPPHHRGTRTSDGMTFSYSVMYRVPLVFGRVGPILSD